MEINLYTADGGFVAKETIPPFNTPPDVICWGQRFFMRADIAGRYVECFAYYVTPLSFAPAPPEESQLPPATG